jgi:hypothetical protein
MAIPSPLAPKNHPNSLNKHDQYSLLPTKGDETPIESRRLKAIERRSGLLSLARVTNIVVLIVCAATYFLSTHGTINRADSLHAGGGGAGGNDSPDIISHTSEYRIPQCAQIKPVAPVHHLDNVWSTLTVEEAVEIRNWLFDEARGLNITQGDLAGMR